VDIGDNLESLIARSEGDTTLHYRVMDGDTAVGELHMRDLVKALVPRLSSTQTG
jgi:glycine betaine/proline transport system ATP-binding protein